MLIKTGIHEKNAARFVKN